MFSLAIILIPVLVSAESRVALTEIAEFAPMYDDYDETVNIADETSKTNIETWNPLPDGIFVGGTIAESLMALNEVGVGDYSHLSVATIMRFQSGYLSNGASEFIVRLPFFIDDEQIPLGMLLEIWEWDGTPITFRYDASGVGNLRIAEYPPGEYLYGTVVANIWFESEEIWRDITHDSWLLDNRLYARIIAPLYTDRDYLFVATGVWEGPMHQFKVYWHPCDLCSDGIKSTRIARAWEPGLDSYVLRDDDVEADAGWSFVFQIGIGGRARDYDRWYYDGQKLTWSKYVQVGAAAVDAAVTFIMEFRTNYNQDLNYSITMTGGGNILLSKVWWDEKTARNVIVAGNPNIKTFNAEEYDGAYWIKFWVYLWIEDDVRMQLMLIDDLDRPAGSYRPWLEISGVGYEDKENYTRVAFAPWCTIVLSDEFIYNETDVIVPLDKTGFWRFAERFMPRQWLDIIDAILVGTGLKEPITVILNWVGGAITPVIKSMWAITSPLIYALYNYWKDFADAVGKFVQMIIDGLKWLGNWIWKIASAIYKALTWFVDRLVFYGSEVMAMIIYALAVIIPVGIIMITTKLMHIMENIARGRVAEAGKEAEALVTGPVKTYKRMKKVF